MMVFSLVIWFCDFLEEFKKFAKNQTLRKSVGNFSELFVGTFWKGRCNAKTHTKETVRRRADDWSV